jgi:hypothetical protein
MRAANRLPLTQTDEFTQSEERILEAGLLLACGYPEDALAADRDYGERALFQARRRGRSGLHPFLSAYVRGTGGHCRGGGSALFEALLECHSPVIGGRVSAGQIVASAGFSSINLPGMLGNVANKLLLQAFTSVDSTYNLIADQAELPNFQTHTMYRLDHLGEFEIVPKDGPIKHGSLGQDAYSNQLATRGTMLTLSRHAIINDDLNAFAALPRLLGRKARLGMEKALYAVVMESSDSFYTTSQGNRLVGSLGIQELAAAEAALLKMGDSNGDPIYAMPKYLLVPTELRYLADQIYTSQYVNDFTPSEPRPTNNPMRNRFQPVSSPFLSSSAFSGSSPSTWYLLADPALVPAFQVATLAGKPVPTIETADTEFNTLGLQMRCYWDFGVARLDYRGAIKSTAS